MLSAACLKSPIGRGITDRSRSKVNPALHPWLPALGRGKAGKSSGCSHNAQQNSSQKWALRA